MSPCPGCHDDQIYTEIAYDTCLGTTEKAIRLRIGDRNVWIPFSLIDESEDVPEAEAANPGSVFVAECFAIKQGLV